MKKFLLATVAAAAVATGASALTVTDVTVRGSVNGTVWTSTTTDGGYYDLFVQNPGLGDFLNTSPAQTVSLPVATSGITRALLAGDGYFPGGNADSDPVYNLTLTFDTGQTLMGSYTPATNTFLGGDAIMSGGKTYSLIEFSYRRDLGDEVSQYRAVPGGDGNDYNGNFRISASGTVPEPASWALMVGGFGLIGAAARRRSRTVAITA